MISCSLALAACGSPDQQRDEPPVDCDAAIVPLLALEDSDSFYVSAARVGEATAFVIIDDHSDERRVVVLDACGSEPRTIVEHAWDVGGRAADAPWHTKFRTDSPDWNNQEWVFDPFGDRPLARLPDGLHWYGELYPEGLLVQRGEEILALPYDEHGLGEPEAFHTAAPPSCEIIVAGVGYWLTDERQIVADDLATGTSTLVFEDVDGCGHTPDHAVMLLTRGSGDQAHQWAFEPATGRTVDLPDASRADVRSLMLEPQLRLLWLDDDWTKDWFGLAVSTAPDGTTLLAAEGNLYRLAPDATEPFWIGDGIGDLVTIEFEDDAFYIREDSPSTFGARKLYRVALDGTGFTDLFGRPLHDPVPLTHDRWAFTAEGGLYLRDVAAGRERLLWPHPFGPIQPLNAWPPLHPDELLFSGTDEDGRNKRIYLARPKLLE